ncbi:molybdenum cofactor sulfurase-like [Cucurbita pepo subsp. pepo]|uniref:molybdenum cofactor sulfurase-like n=1 Tax=Cucurbita pepo subsp. pepo TaxID=3664 RepID=UPI000C9D7C29|nr:molybdenum cofactor sulfurase-like [Cucurbita pepo subsp. pepo]
MQSPCIREASKACLRGCCRPLFLGLPDSSLPLASTPAYNFHGATQTSLHPNARFSDHESIPSLNDAFTYFVRAYPLYPDTQQIDQIRADEYNHLALSKHVCLDYNGQCLFSYAQQQSFPMATAAAYSSSPSGSPPFLHSPGSPFFNISHRSAKPNTQVGNCGQESEFESRIRSRIMRFMNLSEDDYSMVFTANQSSAFKLLADTYPFQYNRNLVTVYDHKSEAVELMVESSKKKGARISSAEFLWPNLTLATGKLRRLIVNKRKKKRKTKRGLFVFPLQSRLTGTPYSYQWLNIARENDWDVCLDTCALGAKDMETLGLSLFKPEFLISSFYKIFGENPSGFGCLFIKKSNVSFIESLVTSPSSIGVISLISTSPQFPFPEEPESTEIKTEQISKPGLQNQNLATPESSNLPKIGEDAEIEEEELSITGIVEIGTPFESARSTNTEMEINCRGLDHADTVGLRLISIRGRYLINWLTNALTNLQHPNAEEGFRQGLVRIYGPKIQINRGPAVAFNVFDWKGEKVDPGMVQKLADRNNISLSNGFLKQISFSEKNEEEFEMRKERVVEEGERTDRSEKRHCWISVVSAGVGFLTNFEDVYRLWAFVSRFLDADFVEKERWRYMALNQNTIEV